MELEIKKSPVRCKHLFCHKIYENYTNINAISIVLLIQQYCKYTEKPEWTLSLLKYIRGKNSDYLDFPTIIIKSQQTKCLINLIKIILNKLNNKIIDFNKIKEKIFDFDLEKEYRLFKQNQTLYIIAIVPSYFGFYMDLYIKEINNKKQNIKFVLPSTIYDIFDQENNKKEYYICSIESKSLNINYKIMPRILYFLPYWNEIFRFLPEYY